MSSVTLGAFGKSGIGSDEGILAIVCELKWKKEIVYFWRGVSRLVPGLDSK